MTNSYLVELGEVYTGELVKADCQITDLIRTGGIVETNYSGPYLVCEINGPFIYYERFLHDLDSWDWDFHRSQEWPIEEYFEKNGLKGIEDMGEPYEHWGIVGWHIRHAEHLGRKPPKDRKKLWDSQCSGFLNELVPCGGKIVQLFEDNKDTVEVIEIGKGLVKQKELFKR